MKKRHAEKWFRLGFNASEPGLDSEIDDAFEEAWIQDGREAEVLKNSRGKGR
jgi:hypothetical protein